MKKTIYTTLVLGVILLFASCQKENGEIQRPETKSPDFTAYVESATKTVFGDVNSAGIPQASLWSGTETMWILDATNNASNSSWKKQYTTTNIEEPSSTATFTEVNNEATLGAGPYFAVYPSSNYDATWDGNTENPTLGNITLNAVQSAVKGGYDPINHVAVSYSTTTSLQFKNVVSFLKVEVPVGCSEVCFFGNNNESVSGTFDVVWNEGNPTVSVTSGLTYAKITGITEAGTYYLAVLPNKFEKGFTLEAKFGDTKYQRPYSKEFTLGRKTILDLGVAGKFSAWSVAGEFNNWTIGANPMKTYKDSEGHWWYKLDNVPLLASGSGFKFVFTSISHEYIWYGKDGDKIANNIEYTDLSTSPESPNICPVQDGTYSVLLSIDEKKFKIVGLQVSTLYLNIPSSAADEWKTDSYGVWFFDGNETDKWGKMTKVKGSESLYSCTVPEGGYKKAVFASMNSSTISWDNKSVQTGNLLIPLVGDSKITYNASTNIWE